MHMDVEQIVREEIRQWLSKQVLGHAVTPIVALTPKPEKAEKPKVARAKKPYGALSDQENAVLTHVAAGFTSAGLVAQELGTEARKVSLTLKRLVDRGLLAKHGERRFTTYSVVNGATA